MIGIQVYDWSVRKAVEIVRGVFNGFPVGKHFANAADMLMRVYVFLFFLDARQETC